MLEHLFGSKTRVRLLRLFLHHPEEAFFVRELARKTHFQMNAVRRELENLVDSSLDFWLTAGRYHARFETELAKFSGVKRALMVNSGSSANLVALSALTSPLWGPRALKAGDEVGVYMQAHHPQRLQWCRTGQRGRCRDPPTSPFYS